MGKKTLKFLYATIATYKMLAKKDSPLHIKPNATLQARFKIFISKLLFDPGEGFFTIIAQQARDLNDYVRIPQYGKTHFLIHKELNSFQTPVTAVAYPAAGTQQQAVISISPPGGQLLSQEELDEMYDKHQIKLGVVMLMSLSSMDERNTFIHKLGEMYAARQTFLLEIEYDFSRLVSLEHYFNSIKPAFPAQTSDEILLKFANKENKRHGVRETHLSMMMEKCSSYCNRLESLKSMSSIISRHGDWIGACSEEQARTVKFRGELNKLSNKEASCAIALPSPAGLPSEQLVE